MDLVIVVLAAGEGTRMKSSHPKVTHPICGKPMINYVIDAACELKPTKIVLVVGHKKDEITATLGDREKCVSDVVVQKQQLGTAHAVLRAQTALSKFKGTILVLNGDVPLISAKLLKNLQRRHAKRRASATVLTALVEKPYGYGRAVRDNKGEIAKIVEEKDATAKERALDEINTGTYCFNGQDLFSALKKVKRDNRQKEYYLTDVIEILNKSNKKVFAFAVDRPEDVLGINSRQQLAKAEESLRERINHEWMDKGVTIVNPSSTFIGSDVKIGKDTTILPFCFIEGETKIGQYCTVGPMTRLIDAKVDHGAAINMSVVIESKIGKDATVGPFSHIRPESDIGPGAKVGSFVEIKKSKIGKMSKVPHLSYIGDTTIGRDVNVGAGTITCNYDGVKKYQTLIDDGAFIGSNTQLVAPVKVGKDAVTGAGSVIAEDVPAQSLAVERSEQKTIKDWSKKRSKK